MKSAEWIYYVALVAGGALAAAMFEFSRKRSHTSWGVSMAWLALFCVVTAISDVWTRLDPGNVWNESVLVYVPMLAYPIFVDSYFRGVTRSTALASILGMTRFVVACVAVFAFIAVALGDRFVPATPLITATAIFIMIFCLLRPWCWAHRRMGDVVIYLLAYLVMMGSASLYVLVRQDYLHNLSEVEMQAISRLGTLFHLATVLAIAGRRLNEMPEQVERFSVD